MNKRTLNQALRQLSPHLALHQAPGYWYLEYDDGVRYETRSVMTLRLNDLREEQWLDEARDFLDDNIRSDA